MTTKLQAIAGDLSDGDHVTATGSDTCGHEVTRTGYLLAEPAQGLSARAGVHTDARDGAR
ncbi:hypothetical protein PV721_26590 [Streptomyces sp. MB09-01]|uniref:hypothetical protein n=1 Tax=Streptomyces sp. MB09-01 TaxID=3028666 RepID=UPI0029B18ABA|nr:hypothetical protein [Streptomyces sp. MB09-01]MDX3537864.1 hypothetical protein [Streptomyces sp. MB09-01]